MHENAEEGQHCLSWVLWKETGIASLSVLFGAKKEYVTGETPSDKLCLKWNSVDLQMSMLRKSAACYSMSFLCSPLFYYYFFL